MPILTPPKVDLTTLREYRLGRIREQMAQDDVALVIAKRIEPGSFSAGGPEAPGLSQSVPARQRPGLLSGAAVVWVKGPGHLHGVGCGIGL